MSGMWVYLKENVKCGARLCDVVSVSERFNKKELSSEETIFDRKTVHPISTPIRELIFRQNLNQTWLYELEKENPSRKIVEMIFERAWTNTPPEKEKEKKKKRTISSVMKVRNSAQSLERFETYRETVKTLVSHHGRGSADGNELLRFHATSLSCGARRRARWRASALCKEYSCGVCKILRSNEFQAEEEEAVSLTSFSGDGEEQGSTTKRAVIVCRIIAGSCKGSSEEDTIVCNPNAVLPCFVIVF